MNKNPQHQPNEAAAGPRTGPWRQLWTFLTILLAITYAQHAHAYLARDENNSLSVSDNCALAINPNGTVLEWLLEQRYQPPFDHRILGPNRVRGISSIVAVSAGEGHRMALRADGTVWVWGSNNGGQLGLGDYVDRESPTQVPGLPSIIAISAGNSHCLALSSGGVVYAWGANYFGEVCNGHASYPLANPPSEPPYPDYRQNTPLPISASNIKDISAGNSYTLLLKNDGTVLGCGSNFDHQLGQEHTGTWYDGTYWYGHLIQIPNLSNIAKISAGDTHAIALRNGDLSVWTWGYNQSGQLGDGTPQSELDEDGYGWPTYRALPQAIPGLVNVSKIAAGELHCIIQKTDGSIWAWGDAEGINTRTDDWYAGCNTPIQVSGASNAVAISAGSSVSLASFLSPGPTGDIRRMTNQGSWGDLGEFPPDMHADSMPLPLGKYESDKLTKTGFSTGPTIYALGDAGDVFAWGKGYTATPSLVQDQPLPQLASLNYINCYIGTNYGTYANIGLQPNGELITWRKQVIASAPTIPPTTIAGINQVAALIPAPGVGPSYALKRDGTVWILGSNLVPTQQALIVENAPNTPINLSSLSNVLQVVAGSSFGLALKKDGTVWAWGMNNGGVMGSAIPVCTTIPTRISSLTNVKSIYAGSSMGYAIKNDNSVWAWGTGYPGNGTYMSYAMNPINITQLNEMVSIYPGANGGYCINRNGQAFAWAPLGNTDGQWGLGRSTRQTPIPTAYTPTLIPALSNVIEIHKYDIYTRFRLENGSIYSCGSDGAVGVLGTGVLNAPNAYTPIPSLF